MFGKKEISPAELRELNGKSFKNTQEIFRRRLREIAKDGEIKAKYNENHYCAGDHIADWLRSLGFTVKRIGPSGWHEITWPEEEDILERLRSKQFKILTHPIPAKVTCVKIEREELGTWKFNPFSYDYVCSVCSKHSAYHTKFCPNCGAKMHIEEDKNGT